MTVSVETLILPKYAENVQTTQYTSTGGKTIIDKFTVTNVSAGTETISINLVKDGDAPGANNLIVKTRSIAAGESYTCPELVGQVLEADGDISTLASALSALVISAAGRVVS